MVAARMSRAARWNLAGATALVTGGSKGIGYITCSDDLLIGIY